MEMMNKLIVLAFLLSSIVVSAQGNNIALNEYDQNHVTITFDCPEKGNLFKYGSSFNMTAVLYNPGEETEANVVVRVATPFGCEYYRNEAKRTLPAKNKYFERITFANSDQLPRGPYTVEVWVEGEILGYSITNACVWDGPTDIINDFFGISYTGSLDAPRVVSDLDLFKSAGIQWIRFPLFGWSPGGGTQPKTSSYDSFITEAVTKRKMNVVAAFVPEAILNPSLNPTQAMKDYRESLVAAASRYKSQVKYWELLRVKPDPTYAELRGIKFGHLKQGREAIRNLDNSLKAIFTLEYPCKWNAKELFDNKLPAGDDIIGMQYSFGGIPEMVTNPAPPINDLQDILSEARSKLKKFPKCWIMEYGFDPAKESNLPPAIHQAALVVRATILDRVAGIERTFWRNNPDSLHDLPIIAADGSANPSFIALRNSLSMLNGATACMPLPAPNAANAHAYIFQFGEKSKDKDAIKPRYKLVSWMETSKPMAVAINTKATAISTSDIWGNTIDLKPTENTAVFPINEFPIFVDLGENFDVQRLQVSFVQFSPSRLTLREGMHNKVQVSLFNDQLLIGGPFAVELRFSRQPGGDEGKSELANLVPFSKKEIVKELSIPKNARKGMIYEIRMDIMMGTRRMGYLTLPVWYDPTQLPTTNEDRHDKTK
jgi:hypothetical protein